MRLDTVAVISACELSTKTVPCPLKQIRWFDILCVSKTLTKIVTSIPPSALGAVNLSSAICWNQPLQLLSWTAELRQTSSVHEAPLPPE